MYLCREIKEKSVKLNEWLTENLKNIYIYRVVSRVYRALTLNYTGSPLLLTPLSPKVTGYFITILIVSVIQVLR